MDSYLPAVVSTCGKNVTSKFFARIAILIVITTLMLLKFKKEEENGQLKNLKL